MKKTILLTHVDTEVSLKDTIVEKKAILENAKIELKKKFFGIDDVIDKFISSVESWYLLPDLRTRPMIVNLWGITGVGKTALVREFVKLIKKEKEYCELCDTQTDTYFLESVFENANMNSDSHAILFIDEFQRLKTKNEKAEEISQDDITDLWTFLSDGSFPIPFNIRQRLDDIYDNICQIDNCNDTTLKYYVTRVYNVLRESFIDLKFDDVKKMSKEEMLEYISLAREKVELYTNKVYSKLLVIISGNLDDAFTFSRDISDADSDPDFIKEISDDITITDIKDALYKRFRPEQISRLGNTHIIYPVLSKKAYNDIINTNIEKLVGEFKEKTGIEFVIDETLLKGVFDNGVFPSQGVRPVLSTIATMVENPMAYFTSKFICDDAQTIVMRYDKDSQLILAGKESYKIENTLEKIRDNVSNDMTTLNAVHEAGHAIAEALLLGVAPKQVTIKSSQNGVGGFCTVHEKMTNSKKQLRSQIQITLGGRAAEEIAFGKKNITSGAMADNMEATSQAINYNCMYGLGERLGYWDGAIGFDMTIDMQKDACDIIELEYNKVLALIKENKRFLISVADRLIKNGTIFAKEFIEIAKLHGVTIKEIKLSETIDDDYSNIYSAFKTKAEKLPIVNKKRNFLSKIKNMFLGLYFSEEA